MPKIDDPQSFFQKLGGLHDARIEDLHWRQRERHLSVYVDDVNSNVLDTPEYPGCQPAEICFDDVVELDISAQIMDRSLSIYDLEVCPAEGHFHVTMKFSPSGIISLQCKEISALK